MLYNLHTHTVRCHHASGTDREYVEAAIQAGMTTLGFADHCPQLFPAETDYYSTFRMRPEEAFEYVESIRRLKREYENDIEILVGFETEYYPRIFDAFCRLIEPLNLDYLIMGQHFLDNEFDTPAVRLNDPGAEVIDKYISQTLEGLRTGRFTYIAHPDILGCPSGNRAYYRARMKGFCTELKALGIPVEYNLLGRKNRRWYPGEEFWNIVAEVGNQVVIGYDAHDPEVLLNRQSYDEAAATLGRMGIRPLTRQELQLRKPT